MNTLSSATMHCPPCPVQVPRASHGFRWRYLFLGAAVCVVLLVATFILSFRAGSEVRTLRRTVFAAAPATWERQFEFGIGRLPTFLAQRALSLVELEPEARVGIESIHSADVGIYRRRFDAPDSDPESLLDPIRDAMARSGWEPLALVRDSGQLVAVFVPTRAPARSTRLDATVFVLKDDQLVLVSARADLQPLLKHGFASGHFPPVLAHARH